MILNIKDKKIIGLIIIVIVLLSILPQIVGWWKAGDNYVFTGTNFTQMYDYPVYLSNIEQARQGNLLTLNLYTAEDQQPVLFSPLWWILGLISRLTTLSPVVIFHLARIALAGLFLIIIWRLTEKLFIEIWPRFLALLIIGLSSGWGVWSFLSTSKILQWPEIFYLAPIDLWVSEANTFLSLYHSPLFIVSQILLVIIIFSWLQPRYQWWLPLASGLLALLHPYDIFILTSLGGVWLVWQIFNKKINRQQLINLLLTALGICPVIFYYYFVVLVEPAMAGWATRNITTTPPFINWFIGYGWLIPLAVVGLVKIRKNINQYWLMIILWLVTVIILLIWPLDIARRFSNGLHIPLSLLAVNGLWEIFIFIKKHFVWRAIVVWLVGGGLIFTNLIIISQDIYNYQSYVQPNYLPKSYYEGVRWLAEYTPTESIILSQPTIGNLLPAFSARRVFIGHGHQTIDFEKKSVIVESFFSTNNNDKQKISWLLSQNIDYLWFDDQTARQSLFQPQEKNYLKTVWRGPGLVIYQLDPNN